eukprot:g544.t1
MKGIFFKRESTREGNNPTPLCSPEDMDLVCRAHQVVEDGYEFFAKRQLITLFSAPNYCGEFDNAGAMMSIDDTLMCSFKDIEDLQWISQSLGIITSTMCISQILTQTNATDDVLSPLSIWPWDSDTWQLFVDGIENVLPIWPLAPALVLVLSTGLLVRQGVAQREGMEIIQLPLPSSSIGHLSSIFFTTSQARRNRAVDFDIAAASPAAMLAMSGTLLMMGVVEATARPSQSLANPGAVQLPAILATALGYSIPVQSDDQLVTPVWLRTAQMLAVLTSRRFTKHVE